MRTNRPARAAFGVALALATAALVPGCGPQLRPATALQSPYAREQLWGIAPFRNESGATIGDPLRVPDALQREIEAVDGISCVPVNRVLLAMEQLGLAEIRTRHDATSVMNVLGLDGLVVGTVTAFDPYPPMVLGAAIELYRQPDDGDDAALDLQSLARATSGAPSPGALGPTGPDAHASGIFSASDHRVLKWLEEYADGRHVPESAYGQAIYLVSMDLYTQFVGHRLLLDVLRAEAARSGPMVAEATER